MSEKLLNKLTSLDEVATPGPWHMRELNDDLCMSGIGVATEPDRYLEEHCFIDPDWPTDKLVAVCLLQEPRLINLQTGGGARTRN